VPIDRSAALRNAEKFLRLGRLDEAIAEYRSVLDDQPLDWNTANALGDLYFRAGQIDRAVDQYVRTADSLAKGGFVVRAAALYKKILKFRPDHEYSLLRAAEIAASQGLVADARACLSSIAERRRASGDHAGVAKMTIQLAALDPTDFRARAAGARARVQLGDRKAALNDLLQLAADAVAKGHLSDAIGALREATDLEPGSLDARARLADAYLVAGDAVQARRFAVTARHFAEVGIALQTAGRSDEALDSWRDGVRLYPSDRNLLQCLGAAYRASGREAEARIVDDELRALIPKGLGVDTTVARVHREEASLVDRGPKVPPSSTLPVARFSDRPVEVDLSLELEIIGKAEAPEKPMEMDVPSGANLEEVFAHLRDRAGRRSGEAGADEAFQRGVALHEAGQDDDALAALREAARGPHRLFAAASLAGRIVRDRGRPADAIEWFERAAQAPPPTREEGHALLFDLADALESIGKVSRALPVYIEVLADAGDYRDVAARVWRLSNRRARE